MDESTLKAIFDWACRHEEHINKFEQDVRILRDGVRYISETDRSSYDHFKMFNGFVVSAVNGMNSVERGRHKDVFDGMASGGKGYANFESDPVKFMEENVKGKFEYGDEVVHVSEMSSRKNVVGDNLDCEPDVVEVEGTKKLSNISNGILECFDDLNGGKETTWLGESVIAESLFEGDGKVGKGDVSLNLMNSDTDHLDDGFCSFVELEDKVASNITSIEEMKYLREMLKGVRKKKKCRNSEESVNRKEKDRKNELGDEEELEIEDKFDEQLQLPKRGNSRKERLLEKAFNCVGVELENEILMELGNVDVDALDISNDLSAVEIAKLEKDVVPVEILRLVYGDDILKSSYPITCNPPCKAELDLLCRNNEKPKMIAMSNVGISNYMRHENLVIKYTMDNSLDLSEIVVATDCVVVRRSHLLSLRPNKLVDSRIINAMVDLLTRHQLQSTPNNLKYWWIPTSVSRPKRFKYDVMSDRSEWDPWVGPLSDCEKIYMPVCVKRHWFLTIIDMKERTAYIYDDLQISSVILGTAVVDTMLKSLDVAFAEEIRLLNEKDGMFDSFPILPPIDYKFRCNEYNCGINVIKQMQGAYNGGKICVHGTKDEERVVVALQLILSIFNKNGSNILNRCITMKESCMDL